MLLEHIQNAEIRKGPQLKIDSIVICAGHFAAINIVYIAVEPDDVTKSELALWVPDPYSTWDFVMISLEQVDAYLLPGSEDPRLHFHVIIKKLKTI